MKRLFDMENPIWRALSAAADLMILNLLTLLCSLPVITAGAALTAMNEGVIRMVRQEEGYVVKSYFRAFASNFKKATLLWLLLLLAAAFLYFDYLSAAAYIPALRLPIVALGVLLFAAALYAFALLARYENTLVRTLKNAVTLAVGYFPRTLCMVIFALGLWIAAIRFYRVGAPVLFLFGLSMPCYICILLLNGVFKKLES